MREADGNAAVCVSSFLSGQRKCPLGGGDQPFRPLKGGLDLDLLQFSDFLRAYNVDIVLVGSVVAVAGFFLGKLLKGRISDKCVVFLPFVLGIALYFAYGAIFTGNVAENAVLFAKNGLSCGSFAMAARVVVAQFFTKVRLHFDPTRQLVIRVELIERNGDRTTIDLKNLKTNTAIDEAVFAID